MNYLSIDEYNEIYFLNAFLASKWIFAAEIHIFLTLSLLEKARSTIDAFMLAISPLFESNPILLSGIVSLVPPTSNAATGVPQAMASMFTVGSDSSRLVFTNTSAILYKFANSPTFSVLLIDEIPNFFEVIGLFLVCSYYNTLEFRS